MCGAIAKSTATPDVRSGGDIRMEKRRKKHQQGTVVNRGRMVLGLEKQKFS